MDVAKASRFQKRTTLLRLWGGRQKDAAQRISSGRRLPMEASTEQQTGLGE